MIGYRIFRGIIFYVVVVNVLETAVVVVVVVVKTLRRCVCSKYNFGVFCNY